MSRSIAVAWQPSMIFVFFLFFFSISWKEILQVLNNSFGGRIAKGREWNNKKKENWTLCVKRWSQSRALHIFHLTDRKWFMNFLYILVPHGCENSTRTIGHVRVPLFKMATLFFFNSIQEMLLMHPFSRAEHKSRFGWVGTFSLSPR